MNYSIKSTWLLRVLISSAIMRFNWQAAAVIGSSIVGGIFANKASKAAASASNAATDAGYAAAMEQLDFEKEQFEWQKSEYARERGYTNARRNVLDRRSDADWSRWNSIYGPLVKNLGSFYNQLDSETFASAGLTELAASFKEAQQNIKTTLAQRGFGGGALEASLLAQGEIANAEKEATIRRDAPFTVAREKSNFMSALGRPGQQSAPNMPNQPSSAGVSNAMANVGNVQLQGGQNLAGIYQNQANSLWSSTGTMLSTGLNLWARNQIPNAAAGTVNSMDATPGNIDYSSMFKDGVDLSMNANA